MRRTEVREEVKGGEAKTHTWYRIPVRGARQISNKDTSSWDLCHGGTCFHACRSETGLKGIMNDGVVRGMPYREGDPTSGSGTHGFYGNAIHNADLQNAPWTENIEGEIYAQQKMNKILIWRMSHHCDTGAVVELRYRAEKKVVNSTEKEETSPAGVLHQDEARRKWREVVLLARGLRDQGALGGATHRADQRRCELQHPGRW